MCKKVFCFIIMLSMLISMGGLNVIANDETSKTGVENIIEAQLIEEKNGIKTYKVTIPIVWTSNEVNEDSQTRAISDCDCYISYNGNGVWEYGLTFSGLDLIKSLKGTLNTWGVGGSTSRTLEATNLVPGPLISVHEELKHLHPVESGEQFFKVSGTVIGVNGSGSFGPQTNSISVKVE